VITSNFEKLRFYIQNAVDHIDFDLFNLTKQQFSLLWLCLAKDNLLNDLPLKIKDSSVLQEEDITKKFWDEISKNIPKWQLLLERKITPVELRKEFVHSTTNSLNALGIVGRVILQKYPENWKEKIRGLKDINWSRNNSEWEGRLLLNGRMLKTTLGVELAANTILKKCGVTLSEDRLKHENRL